MNTYDAEIVLYQASFLELKIRYQMRRLASLKAASGISGYHLEPTGVFGSKTNSKVADIVCEIIECEQELQSLQTKQEKAKKVIRRLLHKAPLDDDTRQMFIDRFINSFKWRDVMARAGISKTYMYKKRREGLKIVQAFIDGLNF